MVAFSVLNRERPTSMVTVLIKRWSDVGDEPEDAETTKPKVIAELTYDDLDRGHAHILSHAISCALGADGMKYSVEVYRNNELVLRTTSR